MTSASEDDAGPEADLDGSARPTEDEPAGSRPVETVAERGPHADGLRADGGAARLSGPELLDALPDAPCPHPGCDGNLERDAFKGTPGVVCRSCETPVVRIWGTATDGR